MYKKYKFSFLAAWHWAGIGIFVDIKNDLKKEQKMIVDLNSRDVVGIAGKNSLLKWKNSQKKPV